MKYSNAVNIDYTNWRGERRIRAILPLTTMIFGKNEYHTEEQWLMEAMDLEDNNLVKTFAMKDIHAWIPVMRDPSKEKGPTDKWPFKKENNEGTK